MELAQQTGLTLKQLNNWFLNARKRMWRTMLRERGHDLEKISTRRQRGHP